MNPVVGAGGMVLAFARALQEYGVNYQRELLVEATDISDICIYMTYIQLSLYGIPAVVYCGNTLSQKMRFKLETPLFYFNYYRFRKFYQINCKEDEKQTQENKNKYTIDTKREKQKILKEVIIKGNSQVSLW